MIMGNVNVDHYITTTSGTKDNNLALICNKTTHEYYGVEMTHKNYASVAPSSY